MPNIVDVADYFLCKVDIDAGSGITPLKLQKLCYYAQAWHVTLEGSPLFDEEFQAWMHGPANLALYRKYKDYGYQNIEPPEGMDFSCFSPEQVELLDEVWDTYGMYDAKFLEDLTHQEDPWKDARRGCLPGDRCSTVITTEAMRRFYSTLVEQQ